MTRAATSLLVLTAVVFAAWPRPSGGDAALLEAYDALARAPVAVQVVGWIDAREPRLQMDESGYVLTVLSDRGGSISIGGHRTPASRDAPPGALTWSEGDAEYSLSGAETNALRQRVVLLADGRAQLTGLSVDSLLLYLLYLPALLAFGAWIIWRAFVEPTPR